MEILVLKLLITATKTLLQAKLLLISFLQVFLHSHFFLNFFSGVYGGSITVLASLGVYPTETCAEYNVTIAQAEQTGNISHSHFFLTFFSGVLSIPACQLVYGATYYLAVYGEPTYGCSDVSFTAQATPVVTSAAVAIDATNGYQGN
jgi:hypothetical protein